jgi:hypothetical protein
MTYPVVPVVPPLGNSKAANASPTDADLATVVGLSPNNTGLPVNAPSIVQQAHGVSSADTTTIAKAFTNPNGVGNSIVVVCGAGNNGTLTVTDTLGNVYQSAVVQANSTTFESQIFYSVGPATGGGIAAGANTVTVTNGGSAASMAVQIYEVSGLLALVSAQPGQNSSGTGTGTTASTSALSSAGSNALAFLGVAVGTTAEAITAVTGTPWTADSSQNSGGTPTGLLSFGSLSLFLPSIAPVIPQATIAASKPWAATAAIFRSVTLPIQGTVHIGGYNYTNITSATTTLVKTGGGVLHAIIVNTRVASGVIEFDDALTHTTPKIGTITFPATLLSDGPIQVQYDIAFATGLSITTTTSGMDITVVWR